MTDQASVWVRRNQRSPWAEYRPEQGHQAIADESLASELGEDVAIEIALQTLYPLTVRDLLDEANVPDEEWADR